MWLFDSILILLYHSTDPLINKFSILGNVLCVNTVHTIDLLGVKLVRKLLEGRVTLLRGSGRFELLRVRVKQRSIILWLHSSNCSTRLEIRSINEI